MGKRGPARTPTEILRAHGDPRAEIRSQTEPEAEAGEISQHDWIDNEAKTMFAELLPQLTWLKKVDGNTLNRYCQTYAKWAATERDIRIARGEIRDRLHARAMRLSELLLRMEIQLGMTPSGRAGMATYQPKNTDAKIRLLKKPSA